MKKSISPPFIKLSQHWHGEVATSGQCTSVGNAQPLPLLLSLSVYGVRHRRRVGYVVVQKKVSGYYGSGLSFLRHRHHAVNVIDEGGSTTVPCRLNSVWSGERGFSLLEVVVALTLLSVSTLLIFQYSEALQLSEQQQWQRREAWRQLAQRLEGAEIAAPALYEYTIAADNGCFWQKVEWRVADHSPLRLERLHCP